MARLRAFVATGALLLAAVALISWFKSNESFLDETISSVSGPETSLSLMLCELISDRISTSCTPLIAEVKERAVRAIRLARVSPSPGHGIRKTERILKISKTGENGYLTTTCVILVEFVDLESELYMFQIDVGENCSGATFKYDVGILKIENFLRPTNQGTESAIGAGEVG